MNQNTFTVIPSTASQAGHRRWLIQIYRRAGIFLAVVALLVMVGAFAATPSAHASGGCWNYNTRATNATYQEDQNPILYRNNNGSPRFGFGYNSCGKTMLLKWSRIICFEGCSGLYYQVDWKRPGYDTWQQFTVTDRAGSTYMTSPFKNVHPGTQYDFAVRACFTHGCEKWSPTVSMNT
ncbi:hypothetical protein KSF_102550 [Reticulibacter mediterranei]|uniref:Fibronectin type-III domain-containing protein n=1 Tax=Reticulibacter mediterranei TaxID=2778369 RepID=A0A8J3N6B9_9CHLR|nr:fibronectin type III domain-containing protein [Reticulibacter mediterranei]GHP00208.1 hypothetical protein KSF_102550 [Reticulibacter mediterranei]